MITYAQHEKLPRLSVSELYNTVQEGQTVEICRSYASGGPSGYYIKKYKVLKVDKKQDWVSIQFGSKSGKWQLSLGYGMGPKFYRQGDDRTCVVKIIK